VGAKLKLKYVMIERQIENLLSLNKINVFYCIKESKCINILIYVPKNIDCDSEILNTLHRMRIITVPRFPGSPWYKLVVSDLNSDLDKINIKNNFYDYFIKTGFVNYIARINNIEITRRNYDCR
jgi:hypothetical protein